MKNFFLLLFFLTVFIACNNDDDHTSQNPIDQLPEATQTGRGIFACLVNGEPFIANNAYFNCYYQYVDGGYYFGIGGDGDEIDRVTSIIIGTYDKPIQEQEVLPLLEELTIGKAWGGARVKSNDPGSLSEKTRTNENFTGELTITKLDLQEYVVSGTFEMDLQDPFTGDTIKIRHGRFDTLFIP